MMLRLIKANLIALILRTERIELSQLEIEDINYIHKFTSNYSNLTPFFSTKIRSKIYWIDKFKKDGLWNDEYGMMKIKNIPDNKIIGLIWFFKPPSQHSQMDCYEIAFNIFIKQYRQTGIAQEAMRVLSSYIFETYNVSRVQSTTMLNLNDESIRRVTKSTGFIFEGTMRKIAFQRGKFVDVHLFSLLREESQKLSELLINIEKD